MGAEIGDRADGDHGASLGGLAAAHAGNEPVALGRPDEQLAGGLGHVRVGGVLDDRRQGPVDIEQDGGTLRVGAQRRERLGEEA